MPKSKSNQPPATLVQRQPVLTIQAISMEIDIRTKNIIEHLEKSRCALGEGKIEVALTEIARAGELALNVLELAPLSPEPKQKR